MAGHAALLQQESRPPCLRIHPQDFILSPGIKISSAITDGCPDISCQFRNLRSLTPNADQNTFHFTVVCPEKPSPLGSSLHTVNGLPFCQRISSRKPGIHLKGHSSIFRNQVGAAGIS